ncbi:MAG TPA: hypothetical protein VNB90_09610 [Cytophagaceae bacterium]|nr:hypothetical protein [Cytophagaceae bacterium]
MKKIYLFPLIILVTVITLGSCVRANPHCKQAHKNIKKLHLNNW